MGGPSSLSDHSYGCMWQSHQHHHHHRPRQRYSQCGFAGLDRNCCGGTGRRTTTAHGVFRRRDPSGRSHDDALPRTTGGTSRQSDMTGQRSSDWRRLGLFALWACVLVSGVNAVSATTRTRKVARRDGDVILGALFSVHEVPRESQATDRTCGDIREQYGVQRVEVLMKTLAEINRDTTILPNVTIGYEIRDSCWYPSVALEQSLEFVSDNIGATGGGTSPHGASSVPVEDQCLPATGVGHGGVKRPTRKPIVGVIGPGSSEVTIQVQNLLQLFNIPQVGYSATSKDLSDKTLYEYFIRVCPSDTLQAQAMVDIVLRYNWSYVSIVHSVGNYGASGMEVFKDLAKRAGVCIATNDNVNSLASNRKFDKVIKNLLKTPTANVVVCFCEGLTVTKLMRATERLGHSGRFLFIGSDGWANRQEIVRGVEREAIGGITIKPQTSNINDFDPYYFALSPENHTENPWFREFWQFRFKCRLPQAKNESATVEAGDLRWTTNCTGTETLASNYNQDTKMGFVINAIYAMAHGLHDMHQAVCPPGTVGLCPAMDPVDGEVFLKHLFNVSFEGASGEKIQFDSNGDPTGRYDIFNFQLLPTGQYEYVRIGEWSAGVLEMNDSAMMWNNASSVRVSSFCTEPCEKGHVKDIRDNVQCCWACLPCKDNQIMIDEFTCKYCEQGSWPNADLSDCVEIEVEYMHWGDIEAVVAVTFSCLGICFTLFVLVTFIRFNSTPVVKSSSRENSYILLCGILMCFLMTFAFIAYPNAAVCYVRRIGLGLSFCICYAALVVRTNRMARILAGSKKKIMTRKPRFLSSTAQVVMTFMVIGIQVIIITALLVIEPPEAVFDYPSLWRVRLICNTTTLGILGPLGFDTFLVVMCTLYAFKTRNLPENFNEAKYITFTMYTTCVVWLAFISLYFGGNEMRSIVVCFAVSLSATVALACLFLPKTYIVLFKPERNRRSSMKTSSLVRMHVGSFSELAPLSSQKSNSLNGSIEIGTARDRVSRSPAINRKRPGKEKGFFSGLRRRKRGYNQVNMMKAVERDRIQRRRQPVYRYSPSSECQPRRVSTCQEEGQGSPRVSEHAGEEPVGETSQAGLPIAVVKPQLDHAVPTTLQEVYRESALRDSSSGSIQQLLSSSEDVRRKSSIGASSVKSSDSVYISMAPEPEVEIRQSDGRPLLMDTTTEQHRPHSDARLHSDVPLIITSFHGSSQGLVAEPQVGQLRNSIETQSSKKRRVSEAPGFPRPGANPFQFLPRRRSHGSLEGKPGVALCSAPPCKHSLKHRKQLAKSAELLCRQSAAALLPTSSTISSFSFAPASGGQGSLLYTTPSTAGDAAPATPCSPTDATASLPYPNASIENNNYKQDEAYDRTEEAQGGPCPSSPQEINMNERGPQPDISHNADRPSVVWNEAKLEELATGQNTPLRTLTEIRSSNV